MLVWMYGRVSYRFYEHREEKNARGVSSQASNGCHSTGLGENILIYSVCVILVLLLL